MGSRSWVIINVSDLTDEMILKSLQTSEATLRKSLDGTKALLKYDGEMPDCFDGMDLYNHSEIKVILNGSDWTDKEI